LVAWQAYIIKTHEFQAEFHLDGCGGLYRCSFIGFEAGKTPRRKGCGEAVRRIFRLSRVLPAGLAAGARAGRRRDAASAKLSNMRKMLDKQVAIDYNPPEP
jgi:hypothetical protein